MKKNLLLVILFSINYLHAQVWNSTIQGNGVVTQNGMNTYTIISNDNTVLNLDNGISYIPLSPIVVSFHWDYITLDDDGSFYDSLFYSINGTRFQIPNFISSTSNRAPQSGNFSISLAAGQTFFVGLNSDDGDYGSGRVIISNLSPPSTTLTLSQPLVPLTSSCSNTAPSAPTTFSVTGSYLSSEVNISAPAGFELSLSAGTNYTSAISLMPTLANTVSSSLYIRLSNATANGISGTITASSAGPVSSTTSVTSTTVASPTFVVNGPYFMCNEATYLLQLSVPNSYNGWSSSDVNKFIVNHDGYVSALSTGTATVSYTDACGQSISKTVTIQNSTPSILITDGKPAYKFNGTPQGPLGGGATINYVGYDGYNYLGQTRPTDVGFYKANIQSGTNAGCPYKYYIFKCSTCTN